MLVRLTSRLSRCFSELKVRSETSVSEPTQAQSSTPIHLRPYNKSKYEVVMNKIKINSGYAFIEIEPFPRAKIMKTCYHIMEQLSIGFPADSIYRIYNEERTKYFMKIVDETTDVQVLEDIFGVEVIEIFIDNLIRQLQVINIMRHSKIWELENDTSFDEQLIETLTPEQQKKYPAYKKSERPRSSFVSE